MSVSQDIPADVLRARRNAVSERRRIHREAALSMNEDWRPFQVTPAAVRADGDPIGLERPTSQCLRDESGTWRYVGSGGAPTT